MLAFCDQGCNPQCRYANHELAAILFAGPPALYICSVNYCER